MSLIERGGGKQVRNLDRRIEYLETYALPLQRKSSSDSEGLAEFIAKGREFREEMIAVIHGDLDARYVDRRLMNAWSATAAKLEWETIATLSKLSAS